MSLWPGRGRTRISPMSPKCDRLTRKIDITRVSTSVFDNPANLSHERLTWQVRGRAIERERETVITLFPGRPGLLRDMR